MTSNSVLSAAVVDGLRCCVVLLLVVVVAVHLLLVQFANSSPTNVTFSLFKSLLMLSFVAFFIIVVVSEIHEFLLASVKY